MIDFDSLLKPMPGKFALELAHRLKECRRQSGHSQISFAKKADVTVASLRRFEQTGEISFISFLKIVFALDRYDELQQLFTKQKFRTLSEAMKNYEKTKLRSRNV